MKKMCFCPVALAVALLVALFLASCSNAPGVPPNVDPMPGIGTPTIPTPVTPGSEILQSAHAKVEKVAGGLMFKITRPTEDVFNPQKVVKEEAFNDYEYVGEGKGSYSRSVEYVGEGGNFKNVHEYVGQGNGSYKLIGKNHYKEAYYQCGAYFQSYSNVGEGNGNVKFEDYYENVGDGNGMFVLENGEYKYVGDGNGNYMRFGRHVYVGDGNGDLKLEYVTAAPNGGNYNYTAEEVDEYFFVGGGRGDYDSYWTTVKDGSGDHKFVYTNVGQGNGNYEYKDTVKTYGNWTNVFIATSGGLSNGVVHAVLDLGSPDKDVLSVFWPLCKPGKLCEYTIQIEPYDGNLRESILHEKLVVAADEGIGEIEKVPKHDEIILSYDGQKPTVKLVGLEPPVGKIQNLRTRCNFFATNQSELKADGSVDWDTNNAIPWIACYDIPGAVDEFVWDDTKYWDSRAFNQIFDEKGKDTLYTSWHIVFDLPVETDGVSSWEFELWGKKNLLKIR